MKYNRLLLRDLRIRAGYTLASLADAVGVSYQAVQQWEAGKSSPRPEAFRRLCEILNWPGFAAVEEPTPTKDIRAIIRATLDADISADQKLEIIRKVVE